MPPITIKKTTTAISVPLPDAVSTRIGDRSHFQNGIPPVAGSLHHIMVIHQHNRPGRPAAFPPEEKASIKIFIFATCEQPRKQFPQQVMKGIKNLFFFLVLPGDRCLPDHCSEALAVHPGTFIRHGESSFLYKYACTFYTFFQFPSRKSRKNLLKNPVFIKNVIKISVSTAFSEHKAALRPYAQPEGMIILFM